jgi:hypothetical protein
MYLNPNQNVPIDLGQYVAYSTSIQSSEELEDSRYDAPTTEAKRDFYLEELLRFYRAYKKIPLETPNEQVHL